MRFPVAVVAMVATALWSAPPSNAYREVHAHTRVEWAGSDCVQVYGASSTNPYLIGSPIWQCFSSHVAAWDEYRATGQIVGIDPEMGDNYWIGCTLWVNGRIEKSDSATAGNGHEVSCLRYVNP